MNSFPIPSNMHFPEEIKEKSESNSIEKKKENAKTKVARVPVLFLTVSDNGVGIPENLDSENP